MVAIKTNRKKVIGIGTGRIVYRLGNDSVLKVANSKYGIRSNKREAAIFRSSPPAIRRWLAAIYAHGQEYSWVKMKKYTRPFPRQKEYTRELYRLRALFRKHGLDPYEMLSSRGKPNYKNLRITKTGKIIVIDYGNFRYCKKKK